MVPGEDYEPWGKSQPQTDGGWRRVDSMSQARKQHAQSQEVREEECAGKESSVKDREIDRRVGSDWDQIVKDLYKPC